MSGALILAALVAAHAPSLAAAQVTATREYLERMDADGDGRVSPAEYLDWMGYAFHAMDRNGDGVLTPEELPGGRGPAVSLEQHRERLSARFARQDANRDGFLDAAELSAPPL
jgi:Ca2+-binding EF-hand superfamily protein